MYDKSGAFNSNNMILEMKALACRLGSCPNSGQIPSHLHFVYEALLYIVALTVDKVQFKKDTPIYPLIFGQYTNVV